MPRRKRPPHYFVSHSHERDDQYDRLERLLKEHLPGFVNRSVPHNRRIYESTDKVWRDIERNIRECDVLILLDTPEVDTSKSIVRELSYAYKKRVPIVAVATRANHGIACSKKIDGEVLKYVYYSLWSSRSIVENIKAALKDGPPDVSD